MQWIEVQNNTRRKVPRWQRSAGVAEDGIVFVPAIVSGNEHAAVMSAAYDGVSMVLHLNHAFLPTAWILKEYPSSREVCELIERNVREALSLEKAPTEPN